MWPGRAMIAGQICEVQEKKNGPDAMLFEWNQPATKKAHTVA
jgi:hypothetical protein